MRLIANEQTPSTAATHSMARTFAWLFASLVMIALLSPPGASQDELHHASSIWCARGERAPYCVEQLGKQGSSSTVRTSITFQNCQQAPDVPLWCPQDASAESQTDSEIRPTLFYFALGWLVVPSVEASVLLMRIVNALVIATIFAIIASLLPSRHRATLLLLILSTFTPSGYFVFASIHPSSWTVLGIGVGWLAWYSIGIQSEESTPRKVRLFSVGALAGVMAVSSGWETVPFLALTVVLVGSRLVCARYPGRRRAVFFLTPVAVAVVIFVFSKVAVLSPGKYLKAIATYSDSEPDTITLFTSYLLHVLPNMLRALGSVPTNSDIILPSLVYLGGLLVLAVLLVATYNSESRFQQVGPAVVILAASIAVMAQAANIGTSVFYGVEPIFVYPLLPFAVGWWFSLGPADLTKRLLPHLKRVVYILTATFALSVFTIAERFVDQQAFGIRLIPDGPDQWWWSWMPVGPNVVVVLSVLFMWRFLDLVRRSLTT